MRPLSQWRLTALALLSAGTLSAQTIAITGATVLPVSGPRLENATVSDAPFVNVKP